LPGGDRFTCKPSKLGNDRNVYPAGLIAARMAIDAWASHTPDEVCAAAVGHAAEWHDQPHRGRRDMHELQR
jgi:hypothetical protein